MDSKTIFSVISAIVSVLSLLGFGTVMTMFWKDRHDKKQRESEENMELRRQRDEQRLINLVSEALDAKLKPLEENLESIKADMAKLKKGVQVTCRNDLEELYATADKNKYCSSEDKNRFESAYWAYHDLGKNGVMDAKRDKILAMPETKPHTKQKLNENK